MSLLELETMPILSSIDDRLVKFWRWVPLRLIIIVPLIILIAIANGLTGWLTLQNSQTAVSEVSDRLRSEILARIEQQIDTELAQSHRVNQINLDLIQSGLLPTDNLEAIGEHFWRQLQMFESLGVIYFGDRRGRFIAAQRLDDGSFIFVKRELPPEPVRVFTAEEGKFGNSVGGIANFIDIRERPWYRAALEKGTFTWGDIFSLQVVPRFDLPASVPFQDARGQVQGVIGNNLSLKTLSDFLQKLRISQNGQTFILERDGKLVASSRLEIPYFLDENKTIKRWQATEIEDRLLRDTALHIQNEFGEFKSIPESYSQCDLNGEHHFLDLLPYKDRWGLDWIVVAVAPESDFMSDIQTHTRTTIALCFYAIAIATGLGIVTARWLSLPLLQLTRAAQEIANGRLEQRVRVHRIREARQLAKSFNQMAEQLHSSFTQLNSLNQALTESESRTRQFLEALPVGVSVHNSKGEPIYINRIGLELVGGQLLQAEMGQISQVFRLYRAGTSQLYPNGALPVVRALAGESVYVEDLEIQHSDRRVPIEVWATPIYENNRVAFAIAAFQDISDRLAIARNLQRSEERYALATAQSGVGVWDWQIDRDEVYLSPNLKTLLGYEDGEMPQGIESLLSFIHREDREGIGQKIQSHLEGTTYVFESTCRIGRRQGSIRLILIRGTASRKQNKPVRIAGTITDITALKATEAKLRQSEASLKAAQRVARVGSWELDVETYRLSWSDEMYRIRGFNRDRGEPTFSDVIAAIDPEDRPEYQEAIARAISCGEAFGLEQRQWRPDGQFIYLDVRGEAQFDHRGQIVKIFGTVLDITERKQAEIALQESESRFRNMAANVPGAIFRYVLHPDGSDSVTYMSPGCWTLWEIEPQVVERDATPLWDAVHPDDRAAMYESVIESARTLRPWCWQWRIITPSGRLKWLQAAGRPGRETNGDVLWDTVILDVSQLKQAEVALRESEERYRLLAENINDLVCLHFPDGRYLYVSPSCKSLLGYDSEELVGVDPYTLFHPDDRQRIRQESHDKALSGSPVPITYRMRTKTGNYIWLETLTKPILSPEGKLVRLQTTSRDVSDRIKAQAQLQHDALHDALTGLPNRQLLVQRLDGALQQCRNSSRPFALLFLDLDSFKLINDSLGHLSGDWLLVAVAQQLQAIVRPTDLVARLGGDEFVILLEHLDTIRDAIAVAKRIFTTFATPHVLEGREVFVSTSIGIVLGTAEYDRGSDLLRDADLALYRAKDRGRGRYEIFNTEMHSQAVERLQLENDLRRALEEELVVYYQPIVALVSGRLLGFEALVRWQHPQRGLLSPDQFIRVAEETGVIVAIDRWILHRACRQLTRWQRSHPQAQPLKIGINLSARDLMGTHLLEDVEAVLNSTGLPGSCLTLEITESMLVENIETTIELLAQLKGWGVQISIDDFGTGYSSLSYLHRLPVDFLKIDRSFVSPMELGDRNSQIIETIVTLSDRLGIAAIAEGIETRQQRQWLAALGCEFGQGYLFAKPLTATEAIELLATQFLWQDLRVTPELH